MNNIMNRVALLVLAMFLAFSSLSAKAQKLKSSIPIKHETTFQPLKLGEKVPNVNLGEIVNYGYSVKPGTKQLKISDFKGRLLILDFWSASCSSCIASFPKLKEVQDKFGDKIVILPVGFTYRSISGSITGDIGKLIDKWKGTNKEMALPSTQQISLWNSGKEINPLRQLFPFQTVPTVVWIDGNSTFRGLTESNAITEDNVRALLEGKNLSFKQKKILKSVAPEQTFLIDRKKTNKRHCFFSNYIDTLRPTGEIRLDTVDKHYLHFYAVNLSVRNFYLSAYKSRLLPMKGISFRKRIIIDSDSQPFYGDIQSLKVADNWAVDSLKKGEYFCYESIFPKPGYNLKVAYQKVIHDLDSFFNIESKPEKRKIKCLKLVKNGTMGSPIISSSTSTDIDAPATWIENTKTGEIQIGGYSNRFSETLNLILGTTTVPVIFNGLAPGDYLTLTYNPAQFKELEDVKAKLKEQHLDLIEFEKEMEVLVLKRLK